MLGFSLIPNLAPEMESPGDANTPAPKAERPAGGDAPARRVHSWVPIRSLAPRHGERIVAHLQQLDERDRYLRFG
jgi:hypothetical protein